MKKKILVLAAVFMLMFSFAGQAMAYFEPGNLIRVVYERGGTKEVLTDLGSGWDLTSATTANALFNTNNFDLSQLGATSWDNVYVAYFAIHATTGDNKAWTSGPDGGQNSSANRWVNVSAASKGLLSGQRLTGEAQNIVLQTDINSFAYRINSSSYGSFKTFIGAANVEQKLNSFSAEGDQFVDQYLYYYSSPNSAQAGVQLFQIRTYENGTTEINPVTTPVPAAIYLLGTGLLGLFGIRRKATEA